MPTTMHEVAERSIHTGKRHIVLGSRPLVMGVLNVTPDSFSDGGQFLDPGKAIAQVNKMVDAGADVIDIGAESTRPGSQAIDIHEELRRLQPVLNRLGKECAVPLSVDTRKAEVAQVAIDCGVDIINDVSAMRFSPEMGRVIAKAGVGVVLMHMKGQPHTMQAHCEYRNVVEEVHQFLQERMTTAESFGIRREQIILDPGIGFGKTVEHNLALIKALSSFQKLGRPILIGVSRKSFIGKVLNRPIHERLMGTASVVAIAVLQGAQIIRVHDVEEMQDVVAMAAAIKTAQGEE